MDTFVLSLLLVTMNKERPSKITVQCMTAVSEE